MTDATLNPQDPQGSTPTPGSQGTAGSSDELVVPPAVQEKYPDLVEMIKKTESMSLEERKYWFQILPIMTPEQIERLKAILAEEANKLAQLDQAYKEELNHLNEKHETEWNTFEIEKMRKEREEQEAVAEKAEEAQEAEILDELEEIDASAPTNTSGV